MTDLQRGDGEVAPPTPLHPLTMSQRGDNINEGSAQEGPAPFAPVPLRGVPMMQQHHPDPNVMMPRYGGCDGDEEQQDPSDSKQQHFMPYSGPPPPHIMGAPSFPPPMGAEYPYGGGIKATAADGTEMPALGGIKGAPEHGHGGEQEPTHDHMMTMMHHHGPPPPLPGSEEMEHAPHAMYGGGEYYPLSYSASAEENMPHGPPPPPHGAGGWYSHPPPPHGGPSPTMMGMPGPPHGHPPPLPPPEYYGHHHPAPHSLPPPPPPPPHMMNMYDQGPPSVDGSYSLGGTLPPPPPPPTDEEATADGSLPSLLTAPSGGSAAYSYHPHNPPPAGLPSGVNGGSYIHDPESYITSNLAMAEQYRRVNPDVPVGWRPRKATTIKAGGTLSKRQLTEGTRKRKVKSCPVKGCPRQSRGVKFDYMCQRHFNESKGIVSNFVDWRMLLQPDEANPGKEDGKTAGKKKVEDDVEKNASVEEASVVEKKEEGGEESGKKTDKLEGGGDCETTAAVEKNSNVANQVEVAI